jgi:glutamine cyclotransferase
MLSYCGISCKERPTSGSGDNTVVQSIVPRIKAVLPHDTEGFTQGLFYDNGRLYESDGLNGKSSLRAIDASSGAVITTVPVATVFAEGCAKLGNDLFQITWQEHEAIIYSFPDLKQERTTIYAGEGWGLTSDGKRFYMSTGSDTIFVRDKEFAIERTIPVRLNGRPANRLNELEYVDGSIYANVWYADYILEINAKNGSVSRIIDCSELVKKENPSAQGNVLNGIAYNPRTRDFYITGKNWKNIFVVEIPR